jgi:hypothetical protein
MDDAFLHFLEQMEEDAKREKELNAPGSARLINCEQVVDAEIAPNQADQPSYVAHREGVERGASR